VEVQDAALVKAHKVVPVRPAVGSEVRFEVVPAMVSSEFKLHEMLREIRG